MSAHDLVQPPPQSRANFKVRSDCSRPCRVEFWASPLDHMGFLVLICSVDHHVLFPFCSELLQFITSGPIVAMEILGDDAVCKWKTLLGPANSAVAQTDAPDSIRVNFGHDGLRNAAHGPDSVASAAQVSFWLFVGWGLFLLYLVTAGSGIPHFFPHLSSELV